MQRGNNSGVLLLQLIEVLHGLRGTSFAHVEAFARQRPSEMADGALNEGARSREA
jgi:hypothetical protein